MLGIALPVVSVTDCESRKPAGATLRRLVAIVISDYRFMSVQQGWENLQVSDFKPSCFFVTGASGFVGVNLCRLLRAEGHKVKGLVRSSDPEKVQVLQDLHVELIKGDLKNPDHFGSALNDVDYVLHAAAIAEFGNGPAYFEINYHGSVALAEACLRHATQLKRFAFCSSIAAVERLRGDLGAAALTEVNTPNPSTDYGKAKLAFEQWLKNSQLPYVVLRPTMIAGPGMRANSHIRIFARMAINKNPVALFNFPGQFSIIHVEDFCRGMILAAQHPDAANKTYFAAGDALALGKIFQMTTRHAGRLFPLMRPGWLRWLAPFLPYKLMTLYFPLLVADDQALQKLGWRRRYTGEETARDVIAAERLV